MAPNQNGIPGRKLEGGTGGTERTFSRVSTFVLPENGGRPVNDS
jgi:hypothetical protein